MRQMAPAVTPVKSRTGGDASAYPACPPDADLAIAEHACEKYSGRVGRSSAAKDLSQDAIDLAVRAHVPSRRCCKRHRFRWTSQ
jgi:hypothetical protein